MQSAKLAWAAQAARLPGLSSPDPSVRRAAIAAARAPSAGAVADLLFDEVYEVPLQSCISHFW